MAFLLPFFQLLLKHEWSWEKFKKDYRSLCARIQKRYGFKASIPFNIEEVNEFLDRKESTNDFKMQQTEFYNLVTLCFKLNFNRIAFAKKYINKNARYTECNCWLCVQHYSFSVISFLLQNIKECLTCLQQRLRRYQSTSSKFSSTTVIIIPQRRISILLSMLSSEVRISKLQIRLIII